jgi:hypothetical protein
MADSQWLFAAEAHLAGLLADFFSEKKWDRGLRAKRPGSIDEL